MNDKNDEVEFGGIVWRQKTTLCWIAYDKRRPECGASRIKLKAMTSRFENLHRDELAKVCVENEAWQWEVDLDNAQIGGVASILGISSSFEDARNAAMNASEFLLGKKPEHWYTHFN